MSISLNNHESRIKSLESRPQGTGISEYLVATDKWWLEFQNGFLVQGGHNRPTTVTLPKSYRDTNYTVLTRATAGDSSGGGGIYSKTVSSFACTTNHNNYSFGWVTFGWSSKAKVLKLYYSFSYNIIYRATHLLEKIFLCLKQRRC